ncbi:MAG: DNA-3-methyladenine glycosylase [Gammaproteobacteria bacterium]|nr:MAG: DNA-3-methyladenine glycosylase [Gammaproteobacteria bacterium]
MTPLPQEFFDRDACTVARALLGKIIRRRYRRQWLAARIIETEAYYLEDRGSHASLGFTEKRKALFMPAGTIYMYYARGKDSLNVSCHGEGNAVLIKSAFPWEDAATGHHALATMQQLNPAADGSLRPLHKLCSGQTLLCQALALKVGDWDQQQFDLQRFYIDDAGIQPDRIIQTTRLGIPRGRDEHLHYRFIDYDYARYCTRNPLSKKAWIEGRDYRVLHPRS